MHDLLITNARLFPLDRDLAQADATTIAVWDGRISGIGVAADTAAHRHVDAGGTCLLPGFIDCHTHALYAGHRMDEHAQRLAGASYADIARAGGGILSTVRAVRAASEAELVRQTLPRVRALAAEGVTTLEIKSGYGLDHDSELKMLRAIRALAGRVPLTLVPTYLGAHAVPEGRARAEYLEEIITRTLPAVAQEGLAGAVDIFVEDIAYRREDLERLFTAARGLGLRCRVHAEQLGNLGASAAAARFNALSSDHLEYIGEAGAEALGRAGTVAVLLPAAWYFLRETTKPPVDLLRRHGVDLAVATDLNPGSAPVASLLAAMHMAATSFGLTPLEVFRGVTLHAARALGLDDRGRLAEGLRADFCLWDIPGPEFLLYQLGGIRPPRVFIRGVET